MTQVSAPQLLIKEINDTYVQSNFKNLRDYFQKQNQLLNFNFVEFNFPAAVTNQKIAHGLALIPQDVIITRISGAGSIILNWSLFDANNLDITSTDACRIRLFVGSYWNYQTALGNQPSDTQSITPILSTLAALASTIATAVSTAVSAAITAATSAFTATSSIPTGAIIDYGGTVAPTGWLMVDGSAVSRTTYAALFVATGSGTIYGAGDGSSTFNLPDVRGRVTVGKDDMGGTAANRITVAGSATNGALLGNGSGNENVALSVAQLPSHNHNILSGTSTGTFLMAGNASSGGVGGGTVTGGLAYYNTTTGTGVNPYIQATGSGAAHSNIQPLIILNKIIKT